MSWAKALYAIVSAIGQLIAHLKRKKLENDLQKAHDDPTGAFADHFGGMLRPADAAKTDFKPVGERAGRDMPGQTGHGQANGIHHQTGGEVVGFKFGPESQKQLATCHPDLQRVLNRAIQIVDFKVVEGHRTIERQQQLFAEGKTKINGTSQLGKHNHSPSLAADIYPFPIDLRDEEKSSARFYHLMGVVKACAHMEGVLLRFGHDWDGDNDYADQSFDDLPHIELA